MRQFDICEARMAGASARKISLLVILQAGLLDDLDTRIVAPLGRVDDVPALPPLRPEIEQVGRNYRLLIDRLSVLSKASIGPVVGTCSGSEHEIKRALDFALFGV